MKTLRQWAGRLRRLYDRHVVQGPAWRRHAFRGGTLPLIVLVLVVVAVVLWPAGQSIGGLQSMVTYDLGAVRQGGAVPGVYVKAIRADLSAIDDTEARKDLFLRILLPHVLRENERIHRLRQRVLSEPPEKLDDLFERYGVENRDIDRLRRRVDIVPPSLALAQAAVESGWGTSRFVRQANNLYGQRTFDEEARGIVPEEGDGSFKVRTFAGIAAAVRSYMHNLNTHDAYAALRRARADLRRRDAGISGAALAAHLTAYSEKGAVYGKAVRQVISANNLADFDKVRLARR